MNDQIDVRTTKARTLTVARFHVTPADMTDLSGQMGAAFGRVMAATRAAGVAVTGPAVACYRPTDDGYDVAAGFPTPTPVAGDGVESIEQPAAEAAHTTHVGSYVELPATYEAIRADMEARGRQLDDAMMWEEYLTGPDVPAQQMRTEVYWPLVPATTE